MSLSPHELEQAKAAIQAALASGRITVADPRAGRSISPSAAAQANRVAVAACRARWRAEGRCTGCGGELPPQGPGFVRRMKCDKCRKRQHVADVQRRTRHRDKALCTQCGGPRDHFDRRTGRRTRQCSLCRERNEAAKRRQSLRHATQTPQLFPHV